MDIELALQTGAPILFREGGLIINQPTLKDIALLGGDEPFFLSSQILGSPKKMLSSVDNIDLEKITNFEILMSIVKDRTDDSKSYREDIINLLTLFFPNSDLTIANDSIKIFDSQLNQERELNSRNYEGFRKIVCEIACLGEEAKREDSSPKGEIARKIEKKLEERRKKLAKLKNEESSENFSVLSRYISILSVGLQKDMNILSNYTVYQLFDEYHRYRLKIDFDINLQARLAGAKDLDEIEDWMKNLHSFNH